MKRFFLLFLALAIPLSAKPKFAADANQQARQAAADLVRQGKIGDAVTYLTANLQVRSGGPDAKAIALVQSLAEISFNLYSQQQLLAARTLANETLTQAGVLLRSNHPDAALPELYLSLGQLCESVIYDAAAAEAFYRAAVAANPGHTRAKAHLQQVQDKIRNQASGRQ